MKQQEGTKEQRRKKKKKKRKKKAMQYDSIQCKEKKALNNAVHEQAKLINS